MNAIVVSADARRKLLPAHPDALVVLVHLLGVAREQRSNLVWSNTKHIATGTGLGCDRVKSARAILIREHLAEYHVDRNPTGHAKRWLIRLLGVQEDGTQLVAQSPQLSDNRGGIHTSGGFLGGNEPTGGIYQSLDRRPPKFSSEKREKKARMKRAPSKNGAAPEGFQPLVALFHELFEKTHREKYTAIPRDFAALKNTLQRHEAAIVEAKLRRYFSEAAWFNDRGARHTLHGFCDHLGEILGGNGHAGHDTVSKMIRCPGCGVLYPPGVECVVCLPKVAHG